MSAYIWGMPARRSPALPDEGFLTRIEQRFNAELQSLTPDREMLEGRSKVKAVWKSYASRRAVKLTDPSSRRQPMSKEEGTQTQLTGLARMRWTPLHMGGMR